MRHRRANSKKLLYLWKTMKVELTWSHTTQGQETTLQSLAKASNFLLNTMSPTSSAGMTKTAHIFSKSSTKEPMIWWTASTACYMETLTKKSLTSKCSSSTREWWRALRWGTSVRVCWHTIRSTRRCRPTAASSTPPCMHSDNGSLISKLQLEICYSISSSSWRASGAVRKRTKASKPRTYLHSSSKSDTNSCQFSSAVSLIPCSRAGD